MARKREDAQPAVQEAPQPMKVDFDAWWAMNEKKIPLQHRKEIILAEFSARGLSMKETMQSYHDALKKYGVKLK